MKRKTFYMLIILIKKNLFPLFSRNVYFQEISIPHLPPPPPHFHPKRGFFCFRPTGIEIPGGACHTASHPLEFP